MSMTRSELQDAAAKAFDGARTADDGAVPAAAS